MTTTASHDALAAPAGWFMRAETWLDARGKGAWIAAMVLGFIFFWPIGLALLAYMIWSKRMFGTCCKQKAARRSPYHAAMRPSGNSAFDAYREDTLARLNQEQQDFDAFMQRLRDAKDKAEFDQFMDERSRARRAAQDDTAEA